MPSGRDAKDTNKREEILDLDDLLPHVGEFGKYQKLLLWLVCLPCCLPCGFCAFNQLFMANVPDHWCAIPELTNITGISTDKRRYLGIPIEKENENITEWSQCQQYAVNWTEILDIYHVDDLEPNPSWAVEPCRNGWEYNLTQVSSSVVIDFDLVCQYDIFPTIGLAALNLGGPIGVYIFGLFNDTLGRRVSFFLCLTTCIIGNCLTASSPTFGIWIFSRFIVGLTVPAIYQIPFIISLELVGPNYRAFVTVMTTLFYTFGLIMLSGVTYIVRNWVHLALITSLPFTLYFGFWFFLPESPRWLLSKARLEEASKILDRLATVNGREFPEDFRQRLRQQLMMQRTVSEEQRIKAGPGILSLCRTPNMRLKTILITLNWFAIQMVYVGLSYYGPALGDNQYVSFLLSSAVEIPSCLLCWVVLDRWGRRWPLTLSMVVSGISCIVTVTLPPDAVVATLVLFLISKSAISASLLIIYPFAGELYPTQVRGIGIGMSSYVGGIGLVIIPFIVYLGTENLVLPLVIMGVISMVCGLTSLRLPETLYHKLPQTIDEGEEFGKDFNCNDCLRCVPIRPSGVDLDSDEIELRQRDVIDLTEDTPLGAVPRARTAMARLVKQQSVMDTPRDTDGTMKMTYWV